jgi:hypothetical protein
MTPAPSPAFESARRRARVAYELGRLRVGALRSLALAALVGVVTALLYRGAGLAWLVVVALAWTAIEWRGGSLLRGGRIGVAGGLVTLTVPMAAFRSCCRAGDMMLGADCCNMTGACAAVGAVVGLAMSVFLVRAPRGHRFEMGVGMAIALLAVASVRCAQLVAGEAVGLLGGLAAGAIASSLVAAIVDRARRTV